MPDRRDEITCLEVDTHLDRGVYGVGACGCKSKWKVWDEKCSDAQCNNYTRDLHREMQNTAKTCWRRTVTKYARS